MRYISTIMATVVLAVPQADAADEDPLVGGKHVSEWKVQLTHAEARVRSRATISLRRLGAQAKPAVPMLTELLGNDSFFVRSLAVNLLSSIGDESNFDQFMKALNDKNALVRGQAATALGTLGTPEDAIPLLIEALHDWDVDGHVRKMATYALAKRGPAAVPALVEALQERRGDVRQAASQALQRIGKPAVPALTDALGTAKGLSRTSVVRTLAEIGPSRAAVSQLQVALTDQDPFLRAAAATALGRTDSRDSATVLKLVNSYRDEKPAVRNSVVSALAKAAPDSEPALATLIAALKDPEPEIRSTAARVLGDLGPKAQPAVPALITALDDKYQFLRSNAARTLGQIGPEARSAIPKLIELLSDRSTLPRQRSATALGEFGSAASAALPALREMQQSPNKRHAKVAEVAIAKIENGDEG